MKILCLFLAVLASTAVTVQGFGLLDAVFHAKDLLDIVGGLVGQVIDTAGNAVFAAERAGERAGRLIPPPEYAAQFSPDYQGPSAEAQRASVPNINPYAGIEVAISPSKPT